jgi:ABC-2 type transport system ATP-binding protein
MIIIEVNNVSKKYGKKLTLHQVSFTVNKGDILGLIGPNGAGKSTILAILATIIKPTTGKALIDGQDAIKHPEKVRKQIGYVPQEIALYPTLTVKDNLKFWAEMAGRRLSKEEIENAADIVHLKEQLHHKVQTLSGGMKRKLNIAVSLLHDPDILILDEPTVGIDIQSKRDITQFIKGLAAKGKTIIYTSHDAHEIEYLCQNIAILNQGKLLFHGTIEDAIALAVQRGMKVSTTDSQHLEDTLCFLGEWDNGKNS